MKNKRFMKNNEGYTLVELIIVLAIIVVLSAAAMITLRAINTAKAKEASTTFKIQLDALAARSKSELAWNDANGNGKYDPNEEYINADPAKNQYMFALYLYKDSSKLYVRPAAAQMSNGGIAQTYDNELSLGVVSDSSRGASLSAYVSIEYTLVASPGSIKHIDPSTSSETGTQASGQWIVFDRNGNCVIGAGEYKFLSRRGGVISTVTINKNGSIQIK